METQIPDISDLKPSVAGHFLLASLGGFVQKKGETFYRAYAVASRLVDKARTEYLEAKESIEAEEAERKMSYEEILKRNEGQFMYTATIINHLENCVNAVARIHKLLPLLNSEYVPANAKNMADIRNTIEHIEERIARAVEGPASLYFLEDKLTLQVGVDSISILQLAKEIQNLHQELHRIVS